MLIRFLPLLVIIWFMGGCTQKTDCRKYATVIQPSGGGARIDCSLDEKKAQKRCVSGSLTSLYAYRSLGEFIEEGQAIGRRRWVSLDATGSLSYRVLTGLAEHKRLVSTATTEGAAVSTSTALDWDAYQRPVKLSGNYNSGTGSTCNGRTETIQFDDAALIMTYQLSYAQSVGTGALAGTPCAGATDSSTVYRYDGDKELVAVDNVTYSILKKAEVCQ